jgi:hypothetical protein
MIYSKDYAELYRRVMAGEHVLCLHYAAGVAGWVYVTDDGRPVVSNKASYAYNLGGTVDVFAARCVFYSIRFVPDNEGLIELLDYVRSDCDYTGKVSKSTYEKINAFLMENLK